MGTLGVEEEGGKEGRGWARRRGGGVGLMRAGWMLRWDGCAGSVVQFEELLLLPFLFSSAFSFVCVCVLVTT